MGLLSWRQRLLIVAFAVLAVAAAVGLWQDGQATARRNADITFQGQADALRTALVERFQVYNNVANAAAGFWQANPNATAEDWRVFTSRLGLWGYDSGVVVLTYTTAVPRAELPAFEARQRRAQGPTFTVHGFPAPAPKALPPPQDTASAPPASPLPAIELEALATDLAMVVTHLEPHSSPRNAVLGLDISTEQRRRLAAEKSRDSGTTVMTDPLRLAATGSSENDFMIFTPVYAPQATINSTYSRRQALQGWVSLGLRGQDIADQVLREPYGRGIAGRIYHVKEDGTPLPIHTLFARDDQVGTNDAAPVFAATRSLQIMGQHWSVEVDSTPAFEDAALIHHWQTLVVYLTLALGSSCGLFLIIVWRQQATLLADTANRKLTATERYYQSVVEGTAEGYWQIDPHSRRTVAVNSALCAMLGYERDEMIGRQPTDFCDQRNRDILRSRLETLWDTDHRLYDLTLLRKDGSELFAHLSETTLRNEQKEVTSVFTMITDMSEFHRLRQALTSKTRELEASNSDLQQFAYVASHDLQAPLRTVSSYLQLLERRYTEQLPIEAKEFIAFASEGARRMSRLIHDLLAFSRVETRGGPMGPCELSAAYAQAMDNLHVAVQSSQAQIDIEAPLPRVLGDAAQLVSLFQNIIGNAIKYCPKDRTPQIVISQPDDEKGIAHIVVTDNGIGIDPSHAERIFLIFQRLHGPEQYEGTGIGLALCKRIIERHDGRIWVEARGEGRGSSFHFTLHLASRSALLGGSSSPS